MVLSVVVDADVHSLCFPGVGTAVDVLSVAFTSSDASAAVAADVAADAAADATVTDSSANTFSSSSVSFCLMDLVFAAGVPGPTVGA